MKQKSDVEEITQRFLEMTNEELQSLSPEDKVLYLDTVVAERRNQLFLLRNKRAQTTSLEISSPPLTTQVSVLRNMLISFKMQHVNCNTEGELVAELPYIITILCPS